MSTIINSMIMSVDQRLGDQDVKEIMITLNEEIFRKEVVFVRFLVVTPLQNEEGRVVINPEDGDALEVAHGTIDAVFTKYNGKVRIGVTKSMVTSKREIVHENMVLVGGEADLNDLIVHLINIINTVLPGEPEDGSDE